MSSRILSNFLRRPRQRPWRAAATTAAGPGDPTIHAGNPTGEEAEEATKYGEAEQQERENHKREKAPAFTVDRREKAPPFVSSFKLESSELAAEPESAQLQQKRRARGLEGAICVGFDGGREDGGEEEKKAAEEYREYLEHHKPSALSEMEMAETRTPMRRATDSDVVPDEAGSREARLLRRNEKEDGVDAALRKAEVLFRRAAQGGDPDTPQGRVLANYRRFVGRTSS